MINIGIGTALLTAVLGYAVVFLGIVFLMAVITLMGRAMRRSNKQAPAQAAVNLGSISAPKGVDPKKVAAIAAVLAEIEGEA